MLPVGLACLEDNKDWKVQHRRGIYAVPAVPGCFESVRHTYMPYLEHFKLFQEGTQSQSLSSRDEAMMIYDVLIALCRWCNSWFCLCPNILGSWMGRLSLYK